jgi:hypothetical protein
MNTASLAQRRRKALVPHKRADFFTLFAKPGGAGGVIAPLAAIFQPIGISDGVNRALPADAAALAALRPADEPSPHSLRALDWFNFFVADIQAGFGPFIAAYLTAQAWTQGHIGIALTVGS